MGEVYLGEDTHLGRKVAIKVLPASFASDPERWARFEQEARAAAALNHPHIAVVHDFGVAAGISKETSPAGEAVVEKTATGDSGDSAGTHFIVQEFLQGHSLGTVVNEEPLPIGKAIGIATEIGGRNQFYSITPDGESFVMVAPQTDGDRINVIYNFFEELNQRVPTGR